MAILKTLLLYKTNLLVFKHLETFVVLYIPTSGHTACDLKHTLPYTVEPKERLHLKDYYNEKYTPNKNVGSEVATLLVEQLPPAPEISCLNPVNGNF